MIIYKLNYIRLFGVINLVLIFKSVFAVAPKLTRKNKKELSGIFLKAQNL